MTLDHEAKEAEKDRRTDVLVAEIKASGYGAMQDIDQNMRSDFQDNMDRIRQTDEFQQTMTLDREKEGARQNQDREKNNIKREEMQLKRELKDVDLQIARENKNQYDQKNSGSDKKKKS